MGRFFKEFRERLDLFEDDFAGAVERRRVMLRYRLERGRAFFEDATVKAQRQARKSTVASLGQTYLRNLVAAPFIYGLIFPLAALDLFATVYQAVAFRLWDIPRVSRRDYVILDRHRLAYLNWVRKLNCLYCGYANGVLAYVTQIARRTEQYWCPIKHAVRIRNVDSRYLDFADYGDADNIEEEFRRQRAALRKDDEASRR